MSPRESDKLLDDRVTAVNAWRAAQEHLARMKARYAGAVEAEEAARIAWENTSSDTITAMLSELTALEMERRK